MPSPDDPFAQLGEKTALAACARRGRISPPAGGLPREEGAGGLIPEGLLEDAHSASRAEEYARGWGDSDLSRTLSSDHIDVRPGRETAFPHLQAKGAEHHGISLKDARASTVVSDPGTWRSGTLHWTRQQGGARN
jgi:hypothetical protein